jgi:hypothetical protein
MLYKDYEERAVIVVYFYNLYRKSNFYDVTVDIKLCPEQLDACDNIRRYKLTITLGPAGSGKTSVIEVVCKYSDTCQILAPTGAAAVRAGNGAMTSHRFIGKSKHKYKDSNEFGDQSTQVTVDEISMVGISTFSKVIIYGKPDELHLVGDDNQLPPVRDGHLLHEILKSGVLDSHTTKLKINHRSNKELEKIQGEFVKDGVMDSSTSTIYNLGRSSTIIEEDQIHTIYAEMCNRSKETHKWNWDSFLVITTNNSVIDEYSYKLSEIFRNSHYCNNPGCFDTMSESMPRNLYPGCIIRYEKNAYDQDCTRVDKDGEEYESKYDFINGVRARLHSIVKYEDSIRLTIEVKFVDGYETVIYTHKDDIPFKFGYISTIHKAQGDEFQEIIFIPRGKWYRKEHVYTAITRTKRRLYVVSEYNDYSISGKIKHPVDILHLMLKEKFNQPSYNMQSLLPRSFRTSPSSTSSLSSSSTSSLLPSSTSVKSLPTNGKVKRMNFNDLVEVAKILNVPNIDLYIPGTKGKNTKALRAIVLEMM